jgi:hypothetical protein
MRFAGTLFVLAALASLLCGCSIGLGVTNAPPNPYRCSGPVDGPGCPR